MCEKKKIEKVLLRVSDVYDTYVIRSLTTLYENIITWLSSLSIFMK